MIDVEEAKQRMMAAVRVLPAETVPLARAVGRFAAADVPAPYDHPLFDVSAMDGYAFAFSETAKQYTVVGEVPAGSIFPQVLAQGECVRIFTGGMLPPSADTVVMQELVQRTGDRIAYADAKLKRGGNVRHTGEQVRAGDVALPQGTLIDAAAIGLLAAVGAREVVVARKPRVAVLVSGGEFIEGGVPQPGKIFGSNDVMLAAALHSTGISTATMHHVDDDRDALRAAWAELAATHDVVLSTGGVSVGDFDLIPAVLHELGADIRFHGVLQKPGKPLLFGRLGDAALFGLPGNPRAVMVLFREYVLPYLLAMQGAASPWMRTAMLPVAQNVSIKGNRAEFRAARVTNAQVELLADEGSHMLRSLAEADAIAYIPADVRELKKDQLVEVHYLK
ncbi:MAG: molybdopterin molybdotransferase MoeA [Bacteroidetes bacterium]|nr:molybdopterin molybdotransferase MoeA [Bacteroidota bacterium]MBS1941633.1 molybdopterin molybdotransferase MoeA [Bacteroidota bacterium]